MKDDEYFGFSTNGDFKVVNLPDDACEDEDGFKLLDLVNFATDGDISIVSLGAREIPGRRICLDYHHASFS